MTNPHRHPSAQVTLLGILILTGVFLGKCELQGQERRNFVVPDSIRLRTPPTIHPKSGLPGTKVTVNAINLPAITPIQIGIGATSTGFEVLDQIMTSPKGQITHTVQVPGWVGNDRSYVFIVFDIYFRPLSLSEPFHVTNQAGLLRRTGQITKRNEMCATMLANDGELYALGGNIKNLGSKREVTVEGVLTEYSQCTQGIAVAVVRIH